MRRGIGGRTVAEAQRRMSYAELIEWAAWQRVVVDEYVRAGKKKQTPVPW